MILLTADEIVMLHTKLVMATGGADGLRDRGLLESAVYGVDAAFGDMEQYPSLEEKAARLAFSLVNNHAFIDGNKRIGILAMLMTLKLNGIDLKYTQLELIRLGVAVANGDADTGAVLNWIQNHTNNSEL